MGDEATLEVWAGVTMSQIVPLPDTGIVPLYGASSSAAYRINCTIDGRRRHDEPTNQTP